jgi:F-type H+-transporting ATPase subunit delta
MSADREQAARRYARALQETLLDTRGEAGAAAAAEQLGALRDLSAGESGAFFANPVFGADEKNAVLQVFFRKHGVDPGIGRFLELLVSLGHVGLLPTIVLAYEEVERERRNELRAGVRSAFPLGEAEERDLAAALSAATGKKVLIETTVDPALIGGVVAEVGSVTYDASVKGYLERLQQEF